MSIPLPEKLRRRIRTNIPMAAYTTFRTGGPAQWFAVPEDEEELLELLAYAENSGIPCLVIGRGSNILAADSGIPGLVIRIAYGSVREESGLLRAAAGLTLARLYGEALRLGYTGLEFASGIPGTLGGAVVMNAGAYGREMKDVIRSVRYRECGGQIREAETSALDFGYRHSIFTDSGRTVLSVLLELPRGNLDTSRQQAAALLQKRQKSQPLEYPSAGSTFKRPPGAYAGTLIEMCGLRGASCGGAQVSEKHGGFIINAGGASSEDILRLVHEVRDAVFRQTGHLLEPEIRLAGDFRKEYR